jgi:hypothetical protein
MIAGWTTRRRGSGGALVFIVSELEEEIPLEVEDVTADALQRLPDEDLLPTLAGAG